MRPLIRGSGGLALFLLLAACLAGPARGDEPAAPKPPDAAGPWAPLTPMLGKWRGTNHGEPRKGTVECEYGSSSAGGSSR